MGKGKVFILSGGRGAGKTTLCAAVLGLAKSRGLDAAGVISPAIFTDGIKTGISARDARSAEIRQLAKLASAGSPGIRTKMWDFDEEVLSWGNAVFESACPCDLLFVDEIGPLELDRGQGWTAALDAVRSGEYRACIMVMRPELLTRAQELFPGSVLVDLARGAPEPSFFLDA